MLILKLFSAYLEFSFNWVSGVSPGSPSVDETLTANVPFLPWLTGTSVPGCREQLISGV